MSHLTGFAETQDAAAAMVNIAALADALGYDDGDDLIVPDFSNVVAIATGIPSGSTERARLDSPSLRRLGLFELGPHNGGADADAEPGSPPALLDLRRSPLGLVAGERLQGEADYDTTAAQLAWIMLWFNQGPIDPIDPQDVFTVRATNGSTLVVDVWTNGALTLAENLPVGRYGIVGMRAQSAGLVAARLVFGDQVERPGVLACDDLNDLGWEGFRYGGMGQLGEFEQSRQPTVDFLSCSADTAQVVHLDLVQLRAGPA